MKRIILSTALICTTTLWSGFDFGECTGSGTFKQHINAYGGDTDNAITVGKIPRGIQGLEVNLDSNKDVDIRLYGINNDKIVHWPNGLIHSKIQETKSYKNVKITYSGYNGIDGHKGHEYIKVTGSSPVEFTIKAFGYQEGDAIVNYSWTGKDGCKSGTGNGHFMQEILSKKTVLVGNIPPNLEDVKVSLKSDKDIDIQLYGEDGKAIIAWPNGLLHGATKDTIDYNNMTIEWSGYNGIKGNKGDEYIKILGKTSEKLTMKVYGYHGGKAEVNYRWGSNKKSKDNTKPVITIMGKEKLKINGEKSFYNPNPTYTDQGAYAEDDKDGNITEKIITNNSVKMKIPGTYTVTYNVTDNAGNNADGKVRKVIVTGDMNSKPDCILNGSQTEKKPKWWNIYCTDHVKPTISLIGNSSIVIKKGETYIDDGATAHDNKDGNITEKISIINNVDTTKLGVYTVLYNVYDTALNTADGKIRTVKVVNNISLAKADIQKVSASGTENEYRFSVTIKSDDINCTQYADWWEIINESGSLIYRRILKHSHKNQQPFTRSGANINISKDEKIYIRAHMNTNGYNGSVFTGSVTQGFILSTDKIIFDEDIKYQDPLPKKCAF